MAKRLKIKSVNGPSDGNQLVNYFFEEFGEGWNIYSPTSSGPINDKLLTSNNPSCTVTVPGYPPFTVTVTQFPVMILSGTWSDGGTASDKDVPGSGTFQAQAGGTGSMDEEASAATAK